MAPSKNLIQDLSEGIHQLDIFYIGPQGFTNVASPSGHQGIRWRNKGHLSWPIELKGVIHGPTTRPTIRLAWRQDFAKTFLPGLNVRRVRLQAKNLDGVNWDGGVNPFGLVETPAIADDTWRVVRVQNEEHAGFMTLELSEPLDVKGAGFPRRTLTSSRCPYRYRGEECQYGGVGKWTYEGKATTKADDDRCAKTLEACRLRFPSGVVRFGGVPTVREG